MVEQFRRFKLAVGFFAQMENCQASSQVLIIRCLAGDQVGGSFDDCFMDIGCLDTVIKLNVGAQLDLRNRYVIQSFCRPIQNSVDFVEIDALCTTITLCHQQTLIHVVFYLSVKEKYPPYYPQSHVVTKSVDKYYM